MRVSNSMAAHRSRVWRSNSLSRKRCASNIRAGGRSAASASTIAAGIGTDLPALEAGLAAFSVGDGSAGGVSARSLSSLNMRSKSERCLTGSAAALGTGGISLTANAPAFSAPASRSSRSRSQLERSGEILIIDGEPSFEVGHVTVTFCAGSNDGTGGVPL